MTAIVKYQTLSTINTASDRNGRDFSVVLCRLPSGSKTVSIQGCDMIPKAKDLLIVPNQELACTAPISPSTAIDVFMNRESALLDMSSRADLEQTLKSMNTTTSLNLSFGSCSDRQDVPFLPHFEETHIAVVALRHSTQDAASLILRSAPKAVTKPNFKSAVYFFPLSFLFADSGAAKAADVFARFEGCQNCGANELAHLGLTYGGADAKVATVSIADN